MKKSLKIFLIILAVVELTQLGIQLTVIFGISTYFNISNPLAGEPSEIEKYTFSLPYVEYEVELEHEDTKKVHSYLSEFTLIMPTLRDYNRMGGQGPYTLNLYMTNGEKHTISFQASEEFHGINVGVISYDGQDYFVDYWMYVYGKSLCEPYQEKYEEESKNN